MPSKPLRIGTRKSKLALWQAQKVQELLAQQHLESILVPIESEGDQNLKQPLYELGIQGIFTKTLDSALLNDTIDLAVHSLKDVPTQLAQGIELTAVLKRGDHRDIIVLKNVDSPLPETGKIATSSLRRQAQWLRKYPQYRCENLRGNVQTRLTKLDQSDWQGALFAQVGLARLDLLNDRPYQVLDWMLPAPAQGAISVCTRQDDRELQAALGSISCAQTTACVRAERAVLRGLKAGCSAPVGALATVDQNLLNLRAGLYSLDGTQAIEIECTGDSEQAEKLGLSLAEEILHTGGEALLQKIRN
jgi:hydroxymethylbilane synthase